MLRKITVREFERGLDYRRGRFVGVLGPGLYRLWPWSGREVTKLDMRETALQVAGQEVLTADNAALRLNVLVRFRIADPALAMHSVASYLDALHQAAQLAARELIATRTMEEALSQRASLAEPLAATVAQRAAEFGVQIVSAVIKDANPDAALKQAFEAKLVADQKAQAELIAARNQVAVARAQANAARVLSENPAMLAQRQLDVLEQAARNGFNNHFVVLPEGLGNLAAAMATQKPTTEAPTDAA